MKMNWMRKGLSVLFLLLALCMVLCSCNTIDNMTGRNVGLGNDVSSREDDLPQAGGGYASIEGIPDYAGKAWVALDDNIPRFTESELTTTSFERYSALDSLGRCGEAVACISTDIGPAKGEKRGDISSVKPTGWKYQKEYESDLVENGYIYNRCHLIAWSLTAENANKQNLITGTRYMNIEGMVPFEDMVRDYVRETGNHVMYRVTPMFAGNNLLASGVRIEGYSVEDGGEDICFHVFAYNVQPGITINYATGENWLNGEKELPDESETPDTQVEGDGSENEITYILNTNTKKIHLPTCKSAQETAESNREETTRTKASLIRDGYKVCGICKP